jgi:fructose-1,6-bisphosphatase/inositol monophosphatase family enzyme
MTNVLLQQVLQEYVRETSARVLQLASQGEGREIVGDVQNRPDDVEIAVDRVGEQVIKELLETYALKASVFSETSRKDLIIEFPEVYGALDPFDNSVLFLRRFHHNWYTVLTFFDKNRKPLAGVVGNIIRQKATLFDETGLHVVDLAKGTSVPIVLGKRPKTLQEVRVLASYTMSSLYSLQFFKVFGELVASLHSHAIVYPYGGSHIYGLLADGRVDAYIMLNEPRSEIDPGFALATSAGCSVVEVDKQGNWRDYEFIPGKQHDKVDLLVAGATPELRDEIIAYYKKTL